VSSVAVQDGAINMTFGNRINSTLRGKVLTFRPAVVVDAPAVPIAWVCGNASVPDKMTVKGLNRTDVPASYHDVTFDAIATLGYPVGSKHRHDWSPAQLAEIERYEGAAVRVVGYLVALKPQVGGSGESTNCHWTAAGEVDWHIALVGEAGRGEEQSVVVETTPRLRRKHAGWKVPTLKGWVDADAPVRISGWLMFDPEHRNHLGKYRATLWEIHPITRIEVWRNGRWEDLDDVR